MIGIDILKKITFFEPLPDDILEKIIPLVRVEKHEPEEILFNQGAALENIFMVVEGKIALKCRVSSGKVIPLDKVHSGETLGLAALIHDSVAGFSAVCARESTIAIMSSKDMLELFSSDYKLGYAVMTRVFERFKVKTDDRTGQFLSALGDHPALAE